MKTALARCGRPAEHSGPTEPATSKRCGRTSSPRPPHVCGTSATVQIPTAMTPTCGPMSSPGDALKDQNVRKALTPLAKVAERTGCTMLLLRHLKKNTRGEPVYLGGGSIGIVGAARAGFMVTGYGDCPDDVRILASVKSNLADTPKSLAYRLVGANDAPTPRSRVARMNEAAKHHPVRARAPPNHRLNRVR